MALNSFAPGHEIVKDKKIYRAVGVVDYEYNQQHIVSVKSGSLNIHTKPLFRCNQCGYSTMSLNTETAKCPVCAQEMEKIQVCSPLGFCVDYNIKTSMVLTIGTLQIAISNLIVKIICNHVRLLKISNYEII